MPFDEQFALLIRTLGRKDKLHKATQSNDPTQAVMNMFKKRNIKF